MILKFAFKALIIFTLAIASWELPKLFWKRFTKKENKGETEDETKLF